MVEFWARCLTHGFVILTETLWGGYPYFTYEQTGLQQLRESMKDSSF